MRTSCDFRPILADEGPRYPWFIGRDSLGARVSHIHVALMGDASLWDRVVFRDYLRRNPDSAAEYAALKRGLAHRLGGDREAYTRAKSAFITEAIASAKAEGEPGAAR